LEEYGLDLNDSWNKDLLPHQGRHPNAYHDFVLEQMNLADELAMGNAELFLKLFQEFVKDKVISNPEMLYSDFWKNK
jgi:hypothetical protein